MAHRQVTAAELLTIVENGGSVRGLDVPEPHEDDGSRTVEGMDGLAQALGRLADAQAAMAAADESRSRMLNEVVMTLQKIIHTRAVAYSKSEPAPDLKTILSQVEAMQAVTHEPNPIYTFKIERHTSGPMRGFTDTIQAIPSPPSPRYDS